MARMRGTCSLKNLRDLFECGARAVKPYGESVTRMRGTFLLTNFRDLLWDRQGDLLSFDNSGCTQLVYDLDVPLTSSIKPTLVRQSRAPHFYQSQFQASNQLWSFKVGLPTSKPTLVHQLSFDPRFNLWSTKVSFEHQTDFWSAKARPSRI